MKKYINFCLLLLCTYNAVAQSVELLPDNKTNLSLPQLSYQQILDIQHPDRGSLVYDSTARCVCIYNGISWDCLHRGGANNPEVTAVWKPDHESDLWGINHTSDAEGNIYISGRAFGPTNFGNNVSIPAGTGQSGFIVKYSPQGKAQWVKYATGSQINIWDIVIGSDSKLYMLGSFDGTLNFDDFHQPNNNGYNLMTVRMDLNGNREWIKLVYGGSMGIMAQELMLDAQNNVYLCGQFSKQTSFSNTTEIIQPTGDYNNGFYMKYNSSGSFQWFKKVNASNDIKIHDLQVAANGDIYMAAIFSGSITIGSLITSAGESDILLIKADNTGNIQWARREGGAKAEYEAKLALVDGKVFVSGSLKTPSNIGGINLTSNLPSGYGELGEMFYGLFNPDTQTWDYVKKSDNGGVYDVTRLKTDTRGNFYTSGSFNPSLKLGNKTLTEAPNGNAFYVKGNMRTGDILHFNGYSSPGVMDFGVSYGLYKNNKNVLIGSFATETMVGEYRLRTFNASSIFVAIVEE